MNETNIIRSRLQLKPAMFYLISTGAEKKSLQGEYEIGKIKIMGRLRNK